MDVQYLTGATVTVVFVSAISNCCCPFTEIEKRQMNRIEFLLRSITPPLYSIKIPKTVNIQKQNMKLIHIIIIYIKHYNQVSVRRFEL
ncbi:MAG: hypothetical protein ACJATI_002521 [Halioglobus sp.]|jgi:hypothetical protein